VRLCIFNSFAGTHIKASNCFFGELQTTLQALNSPFNANDYVAAHNQGQVLLRRHLGFIRVPRATPTRPTTTRTTRTTTTTTTTTITTTRKVQFQKSSSRCHDNNSTNPKMMMRTCAQTTHLFAQFPISCHNKNVWPSKNMSLSLKWTDSVS
jgi:hypothetical protein